MTVYIRLVFLRIGEIDTLNEKYQAQASIEARWPVEFDKLSLDLSSEDQEHLAEGKSISLVNYTKSHWHPQLYIENALGDLKEQIRYSAKKSKEENEIYVCEHRDIKGLFWEKLELQHFPSDVQDLSISIASMLYNDKVVLNAEPYHLSGVNREAFVDQQEWKLYEHVDTEQRFIKEFLFQTTNKEEDDEDDEDDQGENTNNNEGRKRSVLTVTCHAGLYFRKQYSTTIFFSSTFQLFLLEWILSYFFNYYCILLHICHSTKVSDFYSFYVRHDFISFLSTSLAANRIQISATLLLTSITFRWTVNRSLVSLIWHFFFFLDCLSF
jgi:hypothetical protein